MGPFTCYVINCFLGIWPPPPRNANNVGRTHSKRWTSLNRTPPPSIEFRNTWMASIYWQWWSRLCNKIICESRFLIKQTHQLTSYCVHAREQARRNTYKHARAHTRTHTHSRTHTHARTHARIDFYSLPCCGLGDCYITAVIHYYYYYYNYLTTFYAVL